jgi:hypothetical protein
MDDKNSRITPLRLVDPGKDTTSSPTPLPTEGPELLNTVVSLTGLPGDLVETELLKVLEQTGCSGETVTLDELRNALLVYLETFKGDLCSPEKPDDAAH